MWPKLVFNVFGMVTGTAVAVTFLYTWWQNGTVRADWFVWVIFSIGLWRCIVECIVDALEAWLKIVSERRKVERAAADEAVRRFLEGR